MNSQLLLTLLVPTLVAVASWFIGSWLSVRRDRATKRRDLIVQHLIDAYRQLAKATNRVELDLHLAHLDAAIVDIQLFGNAEQIAAAQAFARQLADHQVADLGNLLSSLRNELRQELRHADIAGPVVVLRQKVGQENIEHSSSRTTNK